MSPQDLKPDLEMAQLFLDLLDPGGSFTFQTFEDAKADSGRKARHAHLARIYHGDLSSHAKELTKLQAKGAGVFFMVNQGDNGGRKTTNVQRVRAHFVDLDGAPLDPVIASAMAPHLVVESSPGRWHAYWLVDGGPLDEFKARQQALAQRFGGDPKVCDLPRVMRLPGFWHLKKEPFQTRIVHPCQPKEDAK